ncbi:uncharacterized protein LOC106138832 [Amyelois transitella]|uniref:uncharacterized protein LOC106138832 n=1 Tax=Amyelois transitella TaxID=680683 RepID=UPI00067D05AE|nr:uncharacterized protein LOC106138832 [Amyelois transitella]
MSEIEPEKLIQAVKIRPGLYNKNDPNYFCHKKYKSKMWTEVCKEVYGNWDNLRAQDKVEYAHELQKRWKSLRTCFTRELSLQRKEKLKRERNEGPYKRRKKYEYFDMMTFLLDPDSVEHTEVVNDSGDDSSDPLDQELIKAEYEYEPSASRGRISESNLESAETFQQAVYTANDTVQEKILDMLKDLKKSDDDDDKQFMLSLVPSFKKLNDKQKFEARIGILKVLKAISFQDE